MRVGLSLSISQSSYFSAQIIVPVIMENNAFHYTTTLNHSSNDDEFRKFEHRIQRGGAVTKRVWCNKKVRNCYLSKMIDEGSAFLIHGDRISRSKNC